MESQTKFLELAKLSFMSDTHEMTIIGRVINGTLSYLSEIRIDSSLVNRILNKIQAQNPETEIGELLVCEQLPNGDQFYEMNFEGMTAIIEMQDIEQVSKYIQIRA
jgi:hypothetical protein